MIGFFDSGSGGLTILNEVRKALPSSDLLYLGDHARAPYGHRASADIVAYTKEGVARLYEEGADLVILACNTAAAIALRDMQQNWLASAWPGKRLLGVLVPMVETVTGLPWTDDTGATSGHSHHVMLFATQRTIQSRAYRDEVMKRAPDITLSQIACPGLVDAIEGGAPALALDGMVAGFVKDAVERCGVPDRVILGCTHFPLVQNLFQRHLGDGVQVFNQPDIVARSLSDYLTRHHLKQSNEKGHLQLFTTASDPLSLDLKSLAADISAPSFKSI